MALFVSNVAADTTETAPVPTGTANITVADPDLLQVNYPDDGYFVSYYGTLSYGATLGESTGTVKEMFNVAGPPSSERPTDYRAYYFAFPGEELDFEKFLTLQGEDFQAYIFANDDGLNGSEFNDKLAAYDGNDSISPGAGNDKSWGGKGKDIIYSSAGKDKSWGEGGKDAFWFAEDMDKEIVMDFKKKKDSIVIHKDLAKNFNKFKKIATEKKGNLIANFGDGDKLKVKNVGIDDLEKISFSFLDFDL